MHLALPRQCPLETAVVDLANCFSFPPLPFLPIGSLIFGGEDASLGGVCASPVFWCKTSELLVLMMMMMMFCSC